MHYALASSIFGLAGVLFYFQYYYDVCTPVLVIEKLNTATCIQVQYSIEFYALSAGEPNILALWHSYMLLILQYNVLVYNNVLL